MCAFEKYAWVNNPPRGLVNNLRERVHSVRQAGDEALFAKLRGEGTEKHMAEDQGQTKTDNKGKKRL